MASARFLECWNKFLARGKREQSFDVSVSNSCYLVFGTYGMSIHRFTRKGWHEKYVPDWRNLVAEQVAGILGTQEWVATK